LSLACGNKIKKREKNNTELLYSFAITIGNREEEESNKKKFNILQKLVFRRASLY